MNANHCGASLRRCLKGEVLFNFLIISLSDNSCVSVNNFKPLHELFALMFENIQLKKVLGQKCFQTCCALINLK